MIRVPLREGRTLHHDVEARFGGGNIRMRAAEAGTGIIAGGPLRAVFEVLGIQDVVAKSLGSSNPYNMVKAALEAFQKMESPRMVAGRRGRRVNEVLGRKGDVKEQADG
jgi:small subunit ribosomal protein S5